MTDSTRVCYVSLVIAAFPALLRADDDRLYRQSPEVAAVAAPAEEPDLSDAQSTLTDALKSGPRPSWIWGPDANTQYVLRTKFEGNASAARLKATCDNRMTVYLNGKRVAQSDTWESPTEVDVSEALVEGTNELQVEVANAGGIAAFICKLALKGDDDSTSYVVSGDDWQFAARRDATNWQPVKVIGKAGDRPWGDVLSQPASAVQAGGAFQVPPGFQVELLFTVPKDELGSWVAIGFDHQGRLIASDQGDKGLCRITPPPIGSDEPTLVEHLNVNITAAQGILDAFGSLYLSVNGGPGSGLYRASDLDGDDQYEEVVKLRAFQGGGEHGPHALRLSPDGESIYVIAGNHTQPPFASGADREHAEYSSRIPTNWGEDLLLPRQWDANGHARGILAPGGWIARTDPDGNSWEIVSIGYRNPYDMDFNAEGELFAYDADMEWDLGSPWYRPTRVVHAVSGSEFGWRSGTGKWPTYYPDSLPPAVNIGPGSPVGVTFGYGTRFPAEHQQALFICDWTFGTMYSIHFEPSGASYTAEKREFLSRTPLPLTDNAVGPDGALYFTIGGRGTQSELYRVTYVGDADTSPADAADQQFRDLRALRREIEGYHRPAPNPEKAVAFLYPHLGHADRHIRYAARVGLEFQDPTLWHKRVLAERNPTALANGAIALARTGVAEQLPALLEAFQAIDVSRLSETQQLELLRAEQLAFIRLGEGDEETRAEIAAMWEPLFPSESDALNRELVTMLVYLQSPHIAAKAVPLLEESSDQDAVAASELLERNRGYGGTIANMLANRPDEQQIHYVFVLRNLQAGWTPELRKDYFRWFEKARGWSGGASFQKFLSNIDDEAYANATDTERLAIEAAGARKPYVAPELPKPQGPGHDWTVAELLALSETKLTGRDFENGRKMFAATRCIVCHRFAGDGGATGPDLTQLAGRFNPKDLAEAIIEPSKVISDQYRASVVVTDDGRIQTGRIVSETGDSITLLVDPENSTKVVDIPQSTIEEQQPSQVSLMPNDLLKPLNEDELLDLFAYLLSRGDPRHAMFRR